MSGPEENASQRPSGLLTYNQKSYKEKTTCKRMRCKSGTRTKQNKSENKRLGIKTVDRHASRRIKMLVHLTLRCFRSSCSGILEKEQPHENYVLE